jgi:ATP-dependent DNA ligase
MRQLAQTCEAIGATTRKSEKLAILAAYFRTREARDAAISAVFLSGRAFPAFEERTLQVGGALLWKLAIELAQVSEDSLRVAYRKYGDLGSAAYELLHGRKSTTEAGDVSLKEVRLAFDEISASRGAAAKQALLKSLLQRCSPLDSKYILKVITGDLRIGLKESLVEEAIAQAYEEPLALVQRANMLLGDIGAALELAAGHRLDQARMRPFHPIGFMLASPVATAEEAFTYFEHAQVEDKYDGIRAQAHCGGGQVRLFSRTLDDITASFPELPETLEQLRGEAILDGEIVAWHRDEEGGHAMPFSSIQQRLGRKRVNDALLAAVPVAYIVFDVIYVNGALLLDESLLDRAKALDKLLPPGMQIEPKPVAKQQSQFLFNATDANDRPASGWVLRAPARHADSAEDLESYFEQAMARGNEGLMIKDRQSAYMPGRRGKWWLKLKRALATLDVVVTAAEYGHGKRTHVLSDYTFAVRKGEELVNIGKAYSGLTDVEIAELTSWFLAHTVADHGFVRDVEPEIVLEVAFNAIMRSERHDSGYALRFPRILRIRKDKPVAEINTVEDVEAIYLRQHGREPLR